MGHRIYVDGNLIEIRQEPLTNQEIGDISRRYDAKRIRLIEKSGFQGYNKEVEVIEYRFETNGKDSKK